MSVIAVIPARGGSRGLPGKNIKELAGKPLIVYTLEAAKKANTIDEIYVSTEDSGIADIVKKQSIDVIDRPADLAQDNTPGLPVIIHALDYLEKQEKSVEAVVVLQCTSPLTKAEDIDRAVNKLMQTNADSVVSMQECSGPDNPYWMQKIENERVVPFIKEGMKHATRQELPPVYKLNGAIYVTRPEILHSGKLLGEDTKAYIMPAERSIDIDNEFDFKIAEFLINQNK
jgi:N-acylneuraminate cytidylyltransferase/CMP-N,N'-diacetyllegionaminic acid synthase